MNRRRRHYLLMANSGRWRERPDRWRWSKVSVIHRPQASTSRTSSCPGQIQSYNYRYYEPQSSRYERCIGLSWCSACRSYTATMVYISRRETLWDALAELPHHERERISRSEVRLLDYLDRLQRLGRWPTAD
jgi:hypothetical protein